MKNLTILAACALTAAPLCMPAYAELDTVQEYADACIQVINDAIDIMEELTPATADACIEKLIELKPRLQEIQAVESKFTDEERRMAFMGEKWDAVVKRMQAMIAQLEVAIQNAAPEDRAKLEKVWNTCRDLYK